MSLPDGVKPLDRAGEFCGEKHPTAPSLTCDKRPNHTGAHVTWHNGRAVWWGGEPESSRPTPELEKPPPPDLAGFSSPPTVPAEPLRNPATVAQHPDLDPLAVTSEIAARKVTMPTLGTSVPTSVPTQTPQYSGDMCDQCGAAQMVRTGKCLTCMACGSSSGGCS